TPTLIDLPQRKDKNESNIYAQGMSQSSVALSPATKIHLAPTVNAHKFWNYVIHVIGVGDMSIAVEMVSIEALSANVTRIAFNYRSYYEAGQYMFVNFPNLNVPVSLIAWHPVSFSSAPAVDDINPDTIHMKVQGSFTRRLFAKSQEGMYNVPLKMKVDGPYGKPSLDFLQYRTVMLVAGGIGITPMIMNMDGT
ncbi:6177_t:CDS:2, partial [Racocetra fulgida]